MKRFVKTWIVLAVSALLLSVLASCGREIVELPEPISDTAGKPVSTGKSTNGGKSLIEFCADEEVTAWFNSLDENPPVEMQYWVYGEGPYGMEFLDPELIMQTAKALKTVRIGDSADFDPDSICDAGGSGYYFVMADGSKMNFSFIMNTFQWNKSGYYMVDSYGDLDDISVVLEQIGNPQYQYIYSEDDGFYTKVLETYTTDWQDEEDFFGGLRIYLGEAGEPPFISIARCDTDDPDADYFLYVETDERLAEELSSHGWTLGGTGEYKDFEFRKTTLPGVEYSVTASDGTELALIVLAMETKDSLLRQDRLVRFCIVYPRTDEPEVQKTPTPGIISTGSGTLTQRVMEALDEAVNEFHLKAMYYKQDEVQPNNTLLDFCNDDALRAWFDQAEKNPPLQLVYNAESWYEITDPDAILTVLSALKTVKIGDVSSAHVGGSDRQIFDFIDEAGNPMSFMFFSNVFDWGNESYDVLDWGDLENLDLKKLAD